MTTSTGQFLQVYPPLANGGFNTGALQNLNLNTAQSAPVATSTGAVNVNLPSNDTVPTAAPFDPTNPATYSQSTSTTVYDSLGNSYPATFYFTQTATPGLWDVEHDGQRHPGRRYPNPAILERRHGHGTRQRQSDVRGIHADRRRVADDHDFQFRQFHAIRHAVRRELHHAERLHHGPAEHGLGGFHRHRVRGLHQRPLHAARQLAIANFPNPQGLQQLGDTDWAQTFSSGTVVQGTAGSAGFGTVQSSALESSNVDLTTELVNMITEQRAFQANAQVITTADQMSQTVIGIATNG